MHLPCVRDQWPYYMQMIYATNCIFICLNVYLHVWKCIFICCVEQRSIHPRQHLPPPPTPPSHSFPLSFISLIHSEIHVGHFQPSLSLLLYISFHYFCLPRCILLDFLLLLPWLSCHFCHLPSNKLQSFWHAVHSLLERKYLPLNKY